MHLKRRITAKVFANIIAAGGLLLACATGESLDGPQVGKPGDDAEGAGGGGSSNSGNGEPPIFDTDGGNGRPPNGVDEAGACARSSAVAEPVPAVIEVVLDTSGSMRWVAGEQREPLAGEQSKLDVTKDALTRALDAMPDDSSVGLFVYPGREDDVAGDCLAPQTSTGIAPLSTAQRNLLRSTIANLIAQGGTPTHDAYHLALSELEATALTGDRYMVLITDGVPTYSLGCVGNGTDPVGLDPLGMEAAGALTDSRVRTFVVGSPGSEAARSALSDLASLGGTAQAGCTPSGPTYCHFDMTTTQDFATSLQAALAAIGGETLSCSYEIPQPASGEEIDLNRVNVRFTGSSGATEDILRDPSAVGCETGWQYSEDKNRIVLCDETCDRIRAENDATIEILFGCQTKVKIQ